MICLPDPDASVIARRANIVSALRGLVAPANVIEDDVRLAAYETDAMTAYRRRPLAVVLPESTAQVAAILDYADREAVKIVPRGAGTSLSGGAIPAEDAIVVGMGKFNRILDIDYANRCVVAQSGVTNLALSHAVASEGFYYAPDPSSQIACTIGGNVAENSGGVHCLKYGLTVHNVLRVRGVTMEGESVEFGSLAPDAPGLDLLATIIGSEGMLAVTTEVTVRLVPRPRLARCIMASFADVGHAGDAVAALIAAGIIPAGLEMLDQAASRLVEPFANAGYDLDAAAVLLCESDGTPEEVEAEIEQMCAVLRAARATGIQVSNSEAERLRFWAGRKNAFPAAGRASPAYYCMDGTIPRKRLGEMLRTIQALEDKYQLRCPNVFHAGDGNLHPLILFDDGDPESVARAEAFGAEILERCIEIGGTITGEHGVGVEKLDQMCSQFDPSTREAFVAVKRAFDPAQLLNPGKVIPTLHRCAEYGRMRVSSGKLPFAELPRF